MVTVIYWWLKTGHIDKILAERQIGKRGLYSNHARLEISENIHFHYRDSRLVLTPETMEVLGKMFGSAVKKWNELGRPEIGPNPYEQVDTLAESPLPDEGHHASRFGVEEEKDGTIHIHHRDLRIHLKPADFLFFAREMQTAYLQYCRHHATDVSIKSLKYHQVVDKYVQILSDYDKTGEKIDIDRITEVDGFLTIKNLGSMSPSLGTKRPNGLPDDVPRNIPENMNRLYLLRLYESIKKHGYAKGPYQYQYIRIYGDRNGILTVKDSHRLACLIHLGYDKVKAVVVAAESGWLDDIQQSIENHL